VPASQRSILQNVPGVPAVGAVLIAAGATLIGVLICASGGNELTRTFSVFYLVGCLAAVLAVRYKGLFTAVVQPPLLLFIAVPLAYQFMTVDAGTSPKDIALNAAIPLVNRFPLMLFTTFVTLLLGAYRVYLKRSGPAVASERRTRSTPTRPTPSAQNKPSRPSAGAGPAARSESLPRKRPPRPAPPTGQPPRAPHQARPQRPAPSAQYVRNPAPRPTPDVPAHPMPQVRYRDREGLTYEA
jgi:hypothetical protein